MIQLFKNLWYTLYQSYGRAVCSISVEIGSWPLTASEPLAGGSAPERSGCEIHKWLLESSMAGNVVKRFLQPNCNGLQPNGKSLQPRSDGIQPCFPQLELVSFIHVVYLTHPCLGCQECTNVSSKHARKSKHDPGSVGVYSFLPEWPRLWARIRAAVLKECHPSTSE